MLREKTTRRRVQTVELQKIKSKRRATKYNEDEDEDLLFEDEIPGVNIESFSGKGEQIIASG